MLLCLVPIYAVIGKLSGFAAVAAAMAAKGLALAHVLLVADMALMAVIWALEIPCWNASCSTSTAAASTTRFGC